MSLKPKPLTNEELALIINYLDVKPKAVICTGSYVLSFIENPRDIDYVFFFDNLDTKEKCNLLTAKLLAAFQHLEDTENRRVCLLARDIKNYMHQDTLGNMLGKDYINPWYYLDHYWTTLYGEDTFKLIDVLGKDRVSYIKSLKDSYEEIYSSNKFMTKLYYYIYIGASIIKNDSYYNFTEDQIKDIKILHALDDYLGYLNAVATLKELLNAL